MGPLWPRLGPFFAVDPHFRCNVEIEDRLESQKNATFL